MQASTSAFTSALCVPTFVHHGGRTDTPVVLGLPAMGTVARYYEPFAQALAAATGATVAFADLRGQGDSALRAREGHDFGYREIVEEDLPALVGLLGAQYPGRPIVLLGHSLGGQLAAMAAHQFADRLAGIALIAAGTAHFRSWPHGAPRLRARLAVAGIALAARVLPWYPGDRLRFGGQQPKRLMRDWTLNATTGHYVFQGSRLGHEWATSCLKVPVLSLAVRDDPFAPFGAMEELLGKLSSASVTRASMEGQREHSLTRRHFSWARRPDEAVGHVAHWLEALPRRAPQAGRPALHVQHDASPSLAFHAGARHVLA
jgi:predicted alpha/beta hydrolase